MNKHQGATSVDRGARAGYELEQLKIDYQERWNEGDTPGRSLLDISLISPTTHITFTHKIIQCGEYFQVYSYDDMRIKKKEKNLCLKEKDVRVHRLLNREGDIDENNLVDKVNYKNDYKLDNKKVDIKNINRAKFNLQRLVKSNEKIFKTFITLTFKENIVDVSEANRKFDIWRTKIKSIKKNFAYVCVPEFQKRGAVHYHLLTNLDIQRNSDLIVPQKGKINQYDVRYWSYGFSSVLDMKNINVVGYITKYMTKDIDNRLWGKRKYLYSQNLKRPTVTYLDLSRGEDMLKLFNILDLQKKYEHVYLDVYGQLIKFQEFKKEGG